MIFTGSRNPNPSGQKSPDLTGSGSSPLGLSLFLFSLTCYKDFFLICMFVLGEKLRVLREVGVRREHGQDELHHRVRQPQQVDRHR